MHERPEKGRLSRGCANISLPIMAIFVLLLADYAYVVSNIIPRLAEIEIGDFSTWTLWVDIGTWILFQIFALLTLWAHLRMIYSDPGHIAFDHHYQTELMSTTDQILYAQLRLYRN